MKLLLVLFLLLPGIAFADYYILLQYGVNYCTYDKAINPESFAVSYKVAIEDTTMACTISDYLGGKNVYCTGKDTAITVIFFDDAPTCDAVVKKLNKKTAKPARKKKAV